jgi:hypothetical protein
MAVETKQTVRTVQCLHAVHRLPFGCLYVAGSGDVNPPADVVTTTVRQVQVEESRRLLDQQVGEETGHEAAGVRLGPSLLPYFKGDVAR